MRKHHCWKGVSFLYFLGSKKVAMKSLTNLKTRDSTANVIVPWLFKNAEIAWLHSNLALSSFQKVCRIFFSASYPNMMSCSSFVYCTHLSWLNCFELSQNFIVDGKVTVWHTPVLGTTVDVKWIMHRPLWNFE